MFGIFSILSYVSPNLCDSGSLFATVYLPMS